MKDATDQQLYVFDEVIANSDIPDFHKQELINAFTNDPAGIICGKCNKPNEFVDDAGFFYKHGVALCASCFGPLTGDR